MDRDTERLIMINKTQWRAETTTSPSRTGTERSCISSILLRVIFIYSRTIFSVVFPMFVLYQCVNIYQNLLLRSVVKFFLLLFIFLLICLFILLYNGCLRPFFLPSLRHNFFHPSISACLPPPSWSG